jgi:diadenosine tetraphosphate (Ap4A) HIT family hydrolase
VTKRKWPQDWEQRRAGANCPGCAGGRDEDEHGNRYLSVGHADAYLQRVTPMPGYSVVVFRGRHVPDPTELGPEETVGFWSAVGVAARAIQEVFRPCHINYQILGNAVPHVHVHMVPRYLTDTAPGRPLGEDIWASASPVPPHLLREQVAALVRATQGSAVGDSAANGPIEL